MKQTTAEKLRAAASMTVEEAVKLTGSSPSGLTLADAEKLIGRSRENRAENLFSIIFRSFINPFTTILLAVVIFAVIIGITGESDSFISAGIILAIFTVSGIIQSIQNVRADKSFRRIGRLSESPVTVRRGGLLVDVSASQVAEGDIVVLSAGCRVSADLRLISACDLRVSQAAVTGESRITKKSPEPFTPSEKLPVSKYPNIVFCGSAVISGRGEGVAVAAGKDALFGGVPLARKDKFRRGATNIVKVLLGFMLFLVPLSLLVEGLVTRSFSSAVLFALSVIVGMVPEMLPLVVSVCLSKGSRALMKKKTLVRNVNTMQGFADMDVLCVDKTGTLTDNVMTLEYYLDPLGRESGQVLSHAFLNAKFTGGALNYIDEAVIKFENNPIFSKELAILAGRTKKLDEMPFGYDRKRSAVLLSDGERNAVIAKGNIDEIVAMCSYVQCDGKVLPMPEDKSGSVDAVVGEMLSDGMKVLAVARKYTSRSKLSEEDERDMVLLGYLVFFDAPKKTAKEAVKKLKDCCVDVMILTGDDSEVAVSVCRRIGIASGRVVKGTELETMSDEELTKALETVKIFAELTPDQKVKIVDGLKSNGHTVGYLGDGINDIPALCAADVAISVDTAQDAAKDAADVVLLEKDLNVLADGIYEGRKVFTNVHKYIKITTSSNFGNVLALVLASVFLPFQPMIAVQILTLNILYDILCFTISWDRVDAEELSQARTWTGKGLPGFAVSFGMISTLFDIITFLFLFFVFCPWAVGGSFSSLNGEDALRFVALFQTGWFLESMWSQVLVLNVLRTRKIPFVQSRPSTAFIAAMLVGIILFTLIPFTALGEMLGFVSIPPLYFLYLAVMVPAYVAVVIGVKNLYVKKCGQLI